MTDTPRTARPPEPRTAAGWRMRDKILETIGILRFYGEHEWSQMICAIEAEALPTEEALALLDDTRGAITALENRSVRSGGEFHVWAEERMVTDARDAIAAFIAKHRKEH